MICVTRVGKNGFLSRSVYQRANKKADTCL